MSHEPSLLRPRGSWALSCAVALLIAGVPQQEAFAQSTTATFNIPAESLSDALLSFGQQAGVQLSVESNLVAGKQAPALQGRYTTEEGLRSLLAGSGLSGRFTSGNTVVIEGVSGARVLGPVRVEGATPDIRSTTGVGGAGANGSTDITATENTGSLTSSNVSIGGMRVSSVKEIPQTVSVMTSKRIQEQNLNDVASVLSQLSGVYVRPGVGAGGAQASSRGGGIEKISIDGGISVTSGLSGSYGIDSVEDMAIYDHAELLHGSDGLGQGFTGTGGVLNLVRKKPLDHLQVNVEAQGGSYDLYRGVVDVTAPLAFDGALRGRAVVARQDNNYFYATSDFSRTTYYGILEADVTSNTLVTVGARYKDEDDTPWGYGMPAYLSGKNIPVRRSTCYCYPWENDTIKTDEFFASVEQVLGNDWTAKLSLNRRHTSNDYLEATVYGGVNDITGKGLTMFGASAQSGGGQLTKSADFKATGAFELFGLQQEVSLGANYEDAADQFNNFNTDAPSSLAIDPFNFDPSAVPKPNITDMAYHYKGFGEKTWGANAYTKISVAPKWKVMAGVRFAYTSFHSGVYLGNATEPTLSADVGDRHFAPSYVAVSYDISPAWTTYVSWADAWTSNYGSFGLNGKPVDPTTGSNYEAGLKFQTPGGKLNASLALYRIEQKNFTTYLGPGPDTGSYVADCCYSNDSNQKQTAQGAEIEAAGELLTGWQISASYTFKETKITGSDAGTTVGSSFNTVAPKHLFKLWTTWEPQFDFWNRFSLGLGVNALSRGFLNGRACTAYTASPTGAVCSPGATLPYAYSQAGYTLVSSRIGFKVNPKWDVAFNGDNLLDKKYYARYQNSSFFNNYGDPFTFRLSVNGRF